MGIAREIPEETFKFQLVDERFSRSVHPGEFVLTLINDTDFRTMHPGEACIELRAEGLRNPDRKGFLATEEEKKDPATRDQKLLEITKALFGHVQEAAIAKGINKDDENQFRNEPELHVSSGSIRVKFASTKAADQFFADMAAYLESQQASIRAQTDAIRQERDAKALKALRSRSVIGAEM